MEMPFPEELENLHLEEQKNWKLCRKSTPMRKQMIFRKPACSGRCNSMEEECG